MIEALAFTFSRLAPVHRDFHDKQVVVQEHGGIGVLDFDTLSLGEPAVDVANALAHFELRALQGICSMAAARAAASAFLEGYAPDGATAMRLQPYLDATRLRLACLYALRPAWRQVPESLIRSGRLAPRRRGGRERELRPMPDADRPQPVPLRGRLSALGDDAAPADARCPSRPGGGQRLALHSASARSTCQSGSIRR